LFVVGLNAIPSVVQRAIIPPEERHASHALSLLFLFDPWWPSGCAYVLKGLIISTEERDGRRSHGHPYHMLILSL
jgi:hypothetical protein